MLNLFKLLIEFFLERKPVFLFKLKCWTDIILCFSHCQESELENVRMQIQVLLLLLCSVSIRIKYFFASLNYTLAWLCKYWRWQTCFSVLEAWWENMLNSMMITVVSVYPEIRLSYDWASRIGYVGSHRQSPCNRRNEACFSPTKNSTIGEFLCFVLLSYSVRCCVNVVADRGCFGVCW